MERAMSKCCCPKPPTGTHSRTFLQCPKRLLPVFQKIRSNPSTSICTACTRTVDGAEMYCQHPDYTAPAKRQRSLLKDEVSNLTYLILTDVFTGPVKVYGSWNLWREGTEGLGVTMYLTPGSYEYKYKRQDREWFHDHSQETIPNVVGTLNNVVEVPEDNIQAALHKDNVQGQRPGPGPMKAGERPQETKTVVCKYDFLLVFMRNRLGLLNEDAAGRFGVSPGMCSSLYNTWVCKQPEESLNNTCTLTGMVTISSVFLTSREKSKMSGSRRTYRTLPLDVPHSPAERIALSRRTSRTLPREVPHSVLHSPAERPSKIDAYFVACADAGGVFHDIGPRLVDVPLSSNSLPPGKTIVDVATGGLHSAFCTAEVEVLLCGWNDEGQIARPNAGEQDCRTVAGQLRGYMCFYLFCTGRMRVVHDIAPRLMGVPLWAPANKIAAVAHNVFLTISVGGQHTLVLVEPPTAPSASQ
ncbi:Regulator of chromosome condensation [Branchiostoma belcheri]|nr:Regulator of chromosome condensation [Branchiostoma belcheri]